MAEVPKHRQLSRQLREAIAAGRYVGGARLPSEPQLAKQFGVSRRTVARALLDLQHEGLIERRAGSGTYARGSAPAVAAASTRQLGLLIPGAGKTEVFELICGELATLARVQDYSLLWGGATHPPHDPDASLEYAEQLCRHFIERKARIAGVREAFVRHRLEPDPRWLRVGDPADARFVRSLTAARQADALLCANDHTAALLLRSLETAGVKVPRDVRVVGFDDAKYATLVSPPLTTIHQPCRDIALIALRAMLERIAEPTLPARGSALTPRLVVRESCGAYLPRGTNRSRMSPFWDSTGN